jgi:four helix bundle protein
MAEGFGRYYPGDFAKFMRNALGSLNETRDHLGAGLEKHYLTEELHHELEVLANRAIGASVGLTKYLDESKETWERKRRTRMRRRTPRHKP